MSSISKFKPRSCFFTDPAAITQSSGQAFGPVSADEFRLTSNFTVTTTGTDVLAICSGVVFIQPQTGSSGKVNLILRPLSQPIQGFNIKYFIYRGLDINDFFSAGKVIATTSTTSDLINNINAAFASFYPGSTKPDFMAKFIGFDPTNQSDDLLLDDFFFKQSHDDETAHPDTAYELPKVSLGDTLGTFVTGECGLDIVLNYGDYKLPTPNSDFVFDLSYARVDSASIDLNDISGDQLKKITREQIFQFLDVAAYYGFHTDNDGVVIIDDDSGTQTNKTGDSIYTDVIQNFYTKNRLYLYIQSDRTRSYNFYGNYFIDGTGTSPNSLKMGLDDASLTDRAYQTNGWPLIIEDSPQNHTDARNDLFLQFVTDNNVNTMLYGQVAQIDNAQANNFCDANDLKLPPDTDGNPIPLTNVINISNPATGPDGAKLTVATFNILIYQGITYTFLSGLDTDDSGETIDVLDSPDFFDDVFDIITASPILKKVTDSNYSVISSLRYNLINHFFNKTEYGISAVQTTIINDSIITGFDSPNKVDRVIYTTEAIDLLTTTTSVSDGLTNSTTSSSGVLGAVDSFGTFKLPESFYYTLNEFTDAGQRINGVQIAAKDGTVPNKIILGLTSTENSSLINLITSEMYNPRLFLINLFDIDNNLESPEGASYQKYQIGVVAENAGQLKLYLPDDEVLIYSLDRNYHFSKGYSQYMKSLAYTTEYVIVNPTL